MATIFPRPHRGLSVLLTGKRPAVFAAAVLAMALAGCASTGGLVTQGRVADPDAGRLASARSLANADLPVGTFPKLDWWTAFGDPQLDALIAEALQGTPSLAAASARVRQAAAKAVLADAARGPTIGASVRYSLLQLPESLVPEPIGGDLNSSTIAMLNVDYGLDPWGGKRAQWQAALGRTRAAAVDAQAARLALASRIASSYVALAQAFKDRDVAVEEQARARQLLELSRQRVQAGIDNRLQQRQAESAVAAARQLALAAQQRIDSGRNALAALLGAGPDRGLAIERPRVLHAPPAALPEVLPSELLGHRPDVVAARWRVRAARRGVDASEAAFYPSVNLGAIVGLAAGDLSDLFSQDAVLLQGGPAISLPIFNGKRLRSRLAGSNAGYDLAVAEYNRRLVGALREVADALQAARSLDAQLAASNRALEAARQARELASLRYGAGIGTQLDVLAAQRPLLQLQQQRVALRARRLLATIALDRALGGGLQLTAPASASANSDLPPDIATSATP